MREDSLYFYDGSQMKRFMGFGQMLTLAFACHMKTKELGYKYTICEWHNKVAYLWDNSGNCKGIIKTPKDWKWDIKFVEKGSKVKNMRSIDLSKENSLFNGCPSIMNEKFTMVPLFEYLNKYKQDNHIYPIINVPKYDVKPFILFHNRKSEQTRQLYRNTPDDTLESILKEFKCKYGTSFNYKKFGEESSLDNQFDEVIDYKPNNISELFNIVNNCFKYVGSPTGPLTLPYMFGIPVTLMLDAETKEHYFKKDYTLRYGNTLYDWLNKEKMEYIYV